MAGHPLPLDDARWIGPRADGAGLPVLRVTVGVGTAADAEAFDDTLKATPLRGSGDLHRLAGLEDVDLDRIADRIGGDLHGWIPLVLESEASEQARRICQPRLGCVPERRPAGAYSPRRAPPRILAGLRRALLP